MTLPISFKLDSLDRVEIGRWLEEQKILNDISYDWIRKILTFGNEDDATAFSLKFQIRRFETPIEHKLRYEEDHN